MDLRTSALVKRTLLREGPGFEAQIDWSFHVCPGGFVTIGWRGSVVVSVQRVSRQGSRSHLRLSAAVQPTFARHFTHHISNLKGIINDVASSEILSYSVELRIVLISEVAASRERDRVFSMGVDLDISVEDRARQRRERGRDACMHCQQTNWILKVRVGLAFLALAVLALSLVRMPL